MTTLNDMLGMGQLGGNYLGSMLGGPFDGYGNGLSLLAQYQQQQMSAQAFASMCRAAYDPEAEEIRNAAYAKDRAESWAKEAESVLGRVAFWMGFYSVPVIGWMFAPLVRNLTDRAERMLAEAESWLARFSDEKEQGTNAQLDG